MGCPLKVINQKTGIYIFSKKQVHLRFTDNGEINLCNKFHYSDYKIVYLYMQDGRVSHKFLSIEELYTPLYVT